MWVGGKTELVFVAYYQVNQLCYDNSKLGMCIMNGKTYWVGRNLKYENKLTLNKEPVILDLVQANDDRACLQYDRTFCFSKNKEGVDPEGKMK